MTDATRLREWIENSGVTITFLAKQLGCTRNRVYSILDGSDCTAREIVILADSLHMSTSDRDQIFLSKNVNDIHYASAE